MRIIYMGTPQFAVFPLERLAQSGHQVIAVVTQPDKPAGRGQAMHMSPVKSFALARNMEVLQPARIHEEAFLKRLEELQPDLIVVVAYGKILPQTILDLPKFGCINLHASLLPELRGAAPINWAIMRGHVETGITIMQMDAGMDTGAVIQQEKADILDDDDAESVANFLSVLGAQNLVDVIDKIEKAGSLTALPQDENRATYAPMLTKEDGRIDWTRSTEEIICLMRGAKPWPGAFTTTTRGHLKILRAEPIWPAAEEKIENPKKIKPGTVALALRSQGFAVRTRNGFLFITSAQLEGKRAMSGVDLLNGHLVKMGDVFGVEPD